MEYLNSAVKLKDTLGRRGECEGLLCLSFSALSPIDCVKQVLQLEKKKHPDTTSSLL